MTGWSEEKRRCGNFAADRLITCLPCDLFHPPSFEHFLQVNARGQGGSLPIGGAGAVDSLGSGTVQVSVPVSYIVIHTNALQGGKKTCANIRSEERV